MSYPIYKKIILSLTFLLTLSFSIYAQVGFGSSQKINTDWKFTLSDEAAAKTPLFNDSKWQAVTLPHDWSIQGKLDSTLASCTGYLPGGIGWYRKTLKIPEKELGKKVYLYFEGVYNRSEVYINGQLLGSRPNGYISFMYDATPYIKYGQDNVISVRVDHSRYADSRWYSGSGIYRNVWLVYSNPIHIAQWGVFAYPQIENGKSTLKVETELENTTNKDEKLKIVHELFAPDGKSVASKSFEINVNKGRKDKLAISLDVVNAQLWSLGSPKLYKLKTIVSHNGKSIDSTITVTGFRNFTFNPNTGFALNGRNMKMKGVCLHHDAGVLGAAVPKEVWKKRLIALKEIGVNAIRTSHNPQSPDLYALCDQLGMLVLNEAFDEWEFPKRKWIEGWNVGTPKLDGTFDFFEEWGTTDLADMVRRDRNHISIFAWSIGNEVDYPNDPYSHSILDGNGDFTQKAFGGYKKDAPDANRLSNIAARLVKVVKQYDISRSVTAGLAGVAMSNETEYPGLLDIAGYNYTESRYISDHEKYPKRIIYGSENRHDLKAWKTVLDNDHVFGQFLWTGIDYLGESGKWPSRGFYSGLLDFSGAIKPRGYFRQSLWSEKPMAYLGTYSIDVGAKNIPEDVLSQTEGNNNGQEKFSEDAWSEWNYKKGEKIRVVCYTNTAKAQLMLNGKKIGEAKPYEISNGIIHWDIPFEVGNLEVLGMDKNGKEIARYAIKTPQQAYSIKVVEYDHEIKKNGGVSQIRLQILDKNGIAVENASNEILCQVEGAELLGLEAGNNTDMGDYTDNKQNAYKGKLTAYIRSNGKSENIKVDFSSKGLKSEHININVQ
ncbi:sugar-binding domain-containing protein [Pseudopedobacter beijingensis]|uniref:Sugar-binding domain-containing protein n=1 Tax=Pseudopedobacter beijingensis TaxID=1207056 RepID=A0ABW4ID34_9SPHI